MIKGVRLNRDEKIAIAKQVCEMYAANQFTIHNCLKACGIESESTWNIWQDEIAEIAEFYKKAQTKRQEVLKQDLTHRALHSMQKKLSGFFVEETEHLFETDREGKKILKGVKVKRKFIPPSDTLIQVALYNCDPDNWQNRQNVQHNRKDGNNLFKELTIKVVDGSKPGNKPLLPEGASTEQDYIDVETEGTED